MSHFRAVSLVSTALVGVIALASLAGCRKREKAPERTTASAAPSAIASGRLQPTSPLAAASSLRRPGPPPPMGPPLAVEAGIGIGPIRFGATVATLERHMQMKCEDVSPTLCRFVAAGLEFELADGVVSGMVVHRFDRPVPGAPERRFGTFAGGLLPDVRMTMVPEAVRASLGQPQTSVPVTEQNPNHTVLRETYPGLVLEYDKNPSNGRLMLGAIRIIQRPKAKR